MTGDKAITVVIKHAQRRVDFLEERILELTWEINTLLKDKEDEQLGAIGMRHAVEQERQELLNAIECLGYSDHE